MVTINKKIYVLILISSVANILNLIVRIIEFMRM